jgi:hypothetical protein
LTFVSAANTPTGFNWGGEALPQGFQIIEAPTGRKYRFCKFRLSGVSCKLGTPVVHDSAFGQVTPDVSDALPASAYLHRGSQVFAGIALASHTPASGSTTYGWIMTEGPLGKLLNSKIPTTTVKTYLSTTISVLEGRSYALSTVDGFLSDISTGVSDARVVPNLMYFGAAISAGRKSVATGFIRSYFW